jgi:myo-inositol-1(or 4)-monophosphatase
MDSFISLELYSPHKAEIMAQRFDWIPALLECQENVVEHIRPLLGKVKEPQPDLGRGAGGDQMKLVDLAAEKAIVEVLLRRGLSFTLVSEESGIKEFGRKTKECYVTVDPIDGTTNLVRGLPFYCSSIAVSDGPLLSSVHAGLVADLFHGSTYTASKDKGAFRDGKRIAPSTVASLSDAVIGLDLNTYKDKQVAPQLSDLIQNTKHIRHFGANALELCYVAEGLTDAFVDIRRKLRTTDVAASFLVIKEAGGTITDPDGQPVDASLDPKHTLTFVASGNQSIHRSILSLIGTK